MIKDDNKNIVFEDYSVKKRWNSVNMNDNYFDKVVKYLINKRVVKDEKQAYYLFIIFIIIAIILSFILLKNSVNIESSTVDPSLFN